MPERRRDTKNSNKSFGYDIVTDLVVHRWFKKFRSGDIYLKNDAWRNATQVIEYNELRIIVVSDPFSSNCRGDVRSIKYTLYDSSFKPFARP